MSGRRRRHGLLASVLRRHWNPPDNLEALRAGLPWTVVTGGSEGLGPELARAFMDHNPATLLIARTAETLAETARTLQMERAGVQPAVAVHWQNIDLTVDNAARRIETRVAESGGYVDLLVLNAGMGLAGPFTEHDPGELEQLIALNVAGLTRLARHFLPAMVARGEGGIIMIASLAGFAPGPHQAAYYASKAYVIALGEALAEEVAGTGVRVTVVAPGAFDTDFHRKMGAEGSLYLAIPGTLSKQRVAKSARFGYFLGQRTIVPGLLPKFAAVALRLIPHSLTVPLIARLLRVRKDP